MKLKPRQLTMVGLLIALHVILGNVLALKVWNLKLNLCILTYFIAGYLIGPVAGAFVGALGDLLGALIFPVGPYFFPFTLTAAATGFIFGKLGSLRQKYDKYGRWHGEVNATTIIQTCAAVFLNELLISGILNTALISWLYGATFISLISARWPLLLFNVIVYPFLLTTTAEILTLHFSRPR